MIANGVPLAETEAAERTRVYCVCLFPTDAVVPTVKLVEAVSDAEAVQLANVIYPSGEREVWHHHRLVAHMTAPRAMSAH